MLKVPDLFKSNSDGIPGGTKRAPRRKNGTAQGDPALTRKFGGEILAIEMLMLPNIETKERGSEHASLTEFYKSQQLQRKV